MYVATMDPRIVERPARLGVPREVEARATEPRCQGCGPPPSAGTAITKPHQGSKTSGTSLCRRTDPSLAGHKGPRRPSPTPCQRLPSLTSLPLETSAPSQGGLAIGAHFVRPAGRPDRGMQCGSRFSVQGPRGCCVARHRGTPGAPWGAQGAGPRPAPPWPGSPRHPTAGSAATGLV